MEIAVYGKGGIGKSTVSANLSCALALSGKKVLQIGCDPKHDSVRLLMHGENIRTVLDHLRDTDRHAARPEDILHKGVFDIGCIEAGGPRPGVGCAGRGIISGFEFLQEHHVKEAYDMVVYDVLGDVVCGGFAVPVRREYADEIFLVTSGEYMAIYAANNILRGIRNFDGDTYRRVAGIIFNERKIADEDGRIERFSKAVGLPICARIPRSDAFARAEEGKLPLMEMSAESEPEAASIQKIFMDLASDIIAAGELYPASPLSDEELESVVLARGGQTPVTATVGTDPTGGKTPVTATAGTDPTGGQTPSIDRGDRPPRPASSRMPLYGCAFNGAASAAAHIRDAIVIAHGPRSCAFYTWQSISSPGRKNLFERGILMPSSISPAFVSTDMEQAQAVFGGMDRLRECVEVALERKPPLIIIVSTCVSGIIGDDIRAMEELSTPATQIIAIKADGDIAGDYMTGIRMLYHTLTERLIDPEVKPEGRTVNLVNEISCSYNTEINYRIVKDLLHRMDIGINSRFLGDTTVDSIRNFLRAPLSILATDSEDSLELHSYLMSKFGCRFFQGCYPTGFEATAEWLGSLGDVFECRDRAEEIILGEREVYLSRIRSLGDALKGKRVLITTINTNLDWMLDAAELAGMEFVWIGVLNYLRMEVRVTDRHKDTVTIDSEVDWEKIEEKVREYRPDLVLSNYTSAVEEGDFMVDTMPMTGTAGFHSALPLLERWAMLFETRREGEWKKDEALFEKYYN